MPAPTAIQGKPQVVRVHLWNDSKDRGRVMGAGDAVPADRAN
jgi:hypothetical protein